MNKNNCLEWMIYRYCQRISMLDYKYLFKLATDIHGLIWNCDASKLEIITGC